MYKALDLAINLSLKIDTATSSNWKFQFSLNTVDLLTEPFG